MSETEALMWTLEKDPMLRSTFGNVTILDRVPDAEKLRKRLERAARAFPRLRQRVVSWAGRLAPPEWVDDPWFDLDFHMRVLRVPGDGTERDLLDLAVDLSEDPFDRARPLWQFWVVDGLDGGRGALIQRMHHTITDGEGGVRLSAMFIDLERDAAEPMIAPPEPDDYQGAGAGAPRNLLEATLATVGDLASSQVRTGQRALGGLAGMVRHPSRLPAAVGDVAGLTASLARQLGPVEPARSPLWTARSLGRRLDLLRVPLADAKAAASALGGTVNDLFVTGAAAAAGAYHEALGAPVDELRISMPVSTRAKGGAGGNAFSPTRLLVPTGPMVPRDRFALVHERLAEAKTERAIGAVAAVAGLVNVLPTSTLVRFARQQVGAIDFAVSNVRGAPFDLYIAGAKIEGNYPMGPTAGTAWNLTTLSSGGSLDMGLHCDTAAVAQPALLRDLLEDAYAALLAAGSARRSAR